jgi:maleamate amidohydrolase
MARVWDPFLTENDRRHLALDKPKVPYGFGRKAAVLSVDNYRGVIGDRPEPIEQAVLNWPNSVGPGGWTALEHIRTLLAAARGAGLPVLHATGLAVEDSGIPGWSTRRGTRRDVSDDPAAADRHRRRYDIVEQAAPLPGEVVLRKTAPSAFFGTPLIAQLTSEGIDTLIVCGESVSGCVRATVVDGCSYRLHMIVVEECVYDRHEATRVMNLFDIEQKYGDVLPLAEVLGWITGRSPEAVAPQLEPVGEHRHHGHHHHDHGDHSHVTHGHGGPAELEIPAAVLTRLPAGSVPVSVAHHPIHGHVIEMAGPEVIAAARAEMSAGFGDVEHRILELSPGDVDGDAQWSELMERLGGGVLLIGVGLAPSGQPAEEEVVTDQPCPECGARSASVDSAPERAGLRILVCQECGAAWDV